MERRQFVKLCAASAAFGSAAPDLFAQQEKNLAPRLYQRVRLVDEHGQALKAANLPRERSLIFHYPFFSTPCFLLNLERKTQAALLQTADRQSYQWQGGVGPDQTVVAYSAICAHQLTYPTRDISFINYRAGRGVANRRGQVIHCCSEHSEYDPAAGGRVLGGPAPQPLAAIILEHDRKSDELDAVGTLGGEMFNAFFRKFEFRLAMEHGASARTPSKDFVTVTELENYCKQQVKC